jgi:hypothetical protein
MEVHYSKLKSDQQIHTKINRAYIITGKLKRNIPWIYLRN